MIAGTKVLLGPILPNDFPSLFRWADDLEATLLNETYRPAVWKQQEEFWFASGKDNSRVSFAIRKLGESAILGYIQIAAIDQVHRSALVGIRIGNEHDRGQGYGTEALRLAVDYCWNHLNLSRIGLTVFENNDRAKRVYAALGFETEGVIRKAVFIDGRWLDVTIMSLLHPSRLNRDA
jgi:RimJ/RimL family protein N-acetyltransferase